MAALLACARISPFFLRRSTRLGARPLTVARAPDPHRPSAPGATADLVAAAQPLRPTAWTTEEEHFLRVLREAGL